nr:4Fe-4S dicluster domain-containing protein [uncultured Desulfobacter sp.]
MRYLNLYDSLSCLNCAACMSACSVENRMRLERDQGVDFTRGVNQYLNGSYYLRPRRMEVGQYPDARVLVGFHHCRHCETAACLENCPANAIERRPGGQVVINESACIGCRTCQDACPFDVPFYDAQSGKAKKCIGCYDRVESGLLPACVDACMSGALISGPEDEVIAEGEKRIAQYSERIGQEYILYGKETINSSVGRLGWLTIAAKQDAPYYLMAYNPVKPMMQARNAVKGIGALGAAGVVAGAALHSLYLFSARKNEVKRASENKKGASND